MTDTVHYCSGFSYDGRRFYCLGVQMACGHSFACMSDPAIARHRCAATLTPVLWAAFIAISAFALVYVMFVR